MLFLSYLQGNFVFISQNFNIYIYIDIDIQTNYLFSKYVLSNMNKLNK